MNANRITANSAISNRNSKKIRAQVQNTFAGSFKTKNGHF